MAAGEADLVGSFYEPTWQALMKRTMKCVVAIARANERVLTAARAKWSAKEADKLSKSAMFSMTLAGLAGPGSVVKDGQIDWSKIRIEEAKDSANVTIDGKSHTKLVKVGGKWYLAGPAGATARDMELGVKQQEAQLALMTRVYGAIASGISDGTVTPDNLRAKLAKFVSAGGPGATLREGAGAVSSRPSAVPVKVDLTSPESLGKTILAAAAGRNRSALAQCVTPAKRRDFARVMALDSRVEVMQAPAIAAVRKKFSKDLARYVLAGNLFNKVMPNALAPTAALAHLAATDKATVKQGGNTGVIHIGVASKWQIKKIDGKWYVDPPLPAGFDKEIRYAEQDFKVFEGVFKDVTKGVMDGSLTPKTWATETRRLLSKHSKENP